MPEQVFKSPGFFEQEIDLSIRDKSVTGVPAGVIGTAEMGPAFVPVTVGSFSDFVVRFGDVSSDRFGPYAVKEFLRNRTALTYVRVLGAGANESSSDIETTRDQGTVKNAGFKLVGTEADDGADQYGRHKGVVQFITARHFCSASDEAIGYPMFTDNDSFDLSNAGNHVNLVRGILLVPTGTRAMVMDHSQSYTAYSTSDDVATINGTLSDKLFGTFKLVISSSVGSTFASDENNAGIRIFTASLDPSSENYISKILNTDPERFQEDHHLLYADFAVEHELATVSTRAGAVGLVSGSASASETSGDSSLAFRNAFGRFDTRYSNARTTIFISQPFGTKEYDLFHFETLSDGDIVNDKFKISIRNIKGSTNPLNNYGTFTVEVRDFYDTDTNPRVMESYPLCTLDPNDERYVAKLIGDMSVKFNFDADSKQERRIVVSGKYPNQSAYVRIKMTQAVENKDIPARSLPFGFHGLPCLKTTDTLTDGGQQSTNDDGITPALTWKGDTLGLKLPRRLAVVARPGGGMDSPLSGSIVPPVPMRFKCSKGSVKMTSPSFAGHPGDNELADSRLYWGIKFERLAKTGSVGNSIFKSNAGSDSNALIRSYAKLLGIQKLDMVTTGSGQDAFNNNKFTLANVALSQQVSSTEKIITIVRNELTGTAASHMKEAAYIRNGIPDGKRYTVTDGTRDDRMTLASLASLTSSVYFNRFTPYAKFTNMFYGGFDGVNILDRDMNRLNDRASSTDTGGKALGTLSIGLSSDGTSSGAANAFPAGAGENNNTVASYRAAVDILTDPMISRINILAVPGIKDSFVADHASDGVRSYSKAIYLMDLPAYDHNNVRIYDDSAIPDVDKSSERFDGRAIDNNYVATYFPDLTINDVESNELVFVPSSIAALSALGYSDAISYPWFAPAGFNRASLSNVARTATRLTAADRDTLYEARINPIASFPQAGFVIFGQKTLQQLKSALDRVNVRRMMLEVKRQVVSVANNYVFQQNTAETRANFVAAVSPLLAVIQSQQGIEKFQVVMDGTNNSVEDYENNRLNGRIVVVPTRAVEFIAIDFIITSSGVSFV